VLCGLSIILCEAVHHGQSEHDKTRNNSSSDSCGHVLRDPCVAGSRSSNVTEGSIVLRGEKGGNARESLAGLRTSGTLCGSSGHAPCNSPSKQGRMGFAHYRRDDWGDSL
jgi:hypothetical protein